MLLLFGHLNFVTYLAMSDFVLQTSNGLHVTKPHETQTFIWTISSECNTYKPMKELLRQPTCTIHIETPSLSHILLQMQIIRLSHCREINISTSSRIIKYIRTRSDTILKRSPPRIDQCQNDTTFPSDLEIYCQSLFQLSLTINVKSRFPVNTAYRWISS